MTRGGKAVKGSNERRVVKRPGVGESAATGGSPNVSLALQQRCLNIFRDALKPSVEDAGILQRVKGHLYDRDFAAAFGKEEYLRVYASRWSPSRALGYLGIFDGLSAELSAERVAVHGGQDTNIFKVVCLGGGAGAELIALACWLSIKPDILASRSLRATMVDIASWASTVTVLAHDCTTAPQLSQYASATAIAANNALVSAQDFEVDFQQMDCLSISAQEMARVVGGSSLVTLMFTLNELYSTSIPKTQRLLSQLTDTMKPGACLLVVDSPGSYSTVSINGADKQYPMQWLLDFTLIGGSQMKNGGKEVLPKWEKLVSDESRWFRLPEGLQYPIDLENMRYQIHLYKRIGGDVPE